MSHKEARNIRGVPSGGTAAQDGVLVFIGSEQYFSDLLLRNVVNELVNTAPLRFDDLTGFQDYISQNTAPISLIIVNARLCRDNRDVCHNILDYSARHHPSLRMAIAYWEDDLDQILPREIPQQTMDSARQVVQGYVPMNVGIDIWLSVIRLLICGGRYFPPEVMIRREAAYRRWEEKAASGAGQGAAGEMPPLATGPAVPRRGHGGLTKRETQVIEHVVGGLQNKEIASRLRLSEHTIKLHMHHIISKLSAKNRTEAAMRYVALKDRAV